jgi:hypothetical protein
LIKKYEKAKASIDDIAVEALDTVADEMVSEISYTGTYRTPIEETPKGISVHIKNDNEHNTYKEFGTGVVGKNTPHPNSGTSGWIYDVNEHGEKGWWYPTTDSDTNKTKKLIDGKWYAWTKGMRAHREFYNATDKAKERLEEIIKDKISKL